MGDRQKLFMLNKERIEQAHLSLSEQGVADPLIVVLDMNEPFAAKLVAVVQDYPFAKPTAGNSIVIIPMSETEAVRRFQPIYPNIIHTLGGVAQLQSQGKPNETFRFFFVCDGAAEAGFDTLP